MLYNFAYLCYDSAGFTRLGSKKFSKGENHNEKDSCDRACTGYGALHDPRAFAATTQVITDKNYNITVVDAESNTKLGEATNANSVTAKYDYEAIKTVVTGKFTEDKKMALVKVSGFETLTDVTSVTVDGKDLKVNELAAYYSQVNYNGNMVTFPVELTKSGYTDSFVISVKGKTAAGIETTETAKISVTLKNTADYKNAKTAVIKSISSNQKEMDAYIVGSKIYLDLVENDKATGLNGKTVDITFGDENGANFTKGDLGFRSGEGSEARQGS